MNFTAKIKDYIAEESRVKPFQEKLDVWQSNLDDFLVSHKGLHGEYSIEVFEEIINQQKAVVELKEQVASRKEKYRNLQEEILTQLDWLKGGLLKITIDNTAYLISKAGGQIRVSRAFD